MLVDLFGTGDVPDGECTFAAVTNGGRKDTLACDGEIDGVELRRGLFREEGHGERRLQTSGLLVTREEEQGAEHVLIGLWWGAGEML